MSSRKSKGTKGNKNTRKNKPIPNTKNIDDYLHDSLFPISPNEYITITLETCNELNENPKYNYKVSSIKKHTFTQDVPDYNEYSSLTMEALQEGINKLNLKDSNSFIRLMLISGDEGLKIWKLDNQKYETNTNNKEKCGYGTPIYEELIPIAYDADSSIEPVVLQPIQNEGFVEEQQEQIDLPDILVPDIEAKPEPIIEPEPISEVTDDIISEPDIEAKPEDEDEDDEDDDETWRTTAPSIALLNMIDETINQVRDTEYNDDKTEISDNMILLKALVDELDKISKFLTPISPIPTILGKSKCNTALNYIKNNQGESIYNDDLYDDYAMVNDKYETYITYKTGWLSDDFEKHKQNFIKELDNFKKNLVEKIFSTFEYGDSEYCKNKSTNNNDEFIKSVEDANERAENVLNTDVNKHAKTVSTNDANNGVKTGFSQDDSVINSVDKQKFLRSNSEPTIPIQDIKSTQPTQKYNSFVRSKPLFPQSTQNEISNVDKKLKQITSLPGFIKEAKKQNRNIKNAFDLWNKGKPSSTHETFHRFSSDWDKQTGKGKKTKKKQRSNTKTVKNMERKRKTRKNTK